MTATDHLFPRHGAAALRCPEPRRPRARHHLHPEPDCSAASVVLRTDDEDGLEGHALAFTTGRGNDNQANAIGALADHVVGTRAIEFVDHLHEHLVTPVVVRDGHDVAPRALGLVAQLHPQSLADHRVPDGPVWRD